MNKLNRFYLSQNISIDNALSMNQILHQIVNQIKEIVDFINNLELRANEYTDEQIRILNDQLQEQLAALEQTLKTYTDDSIGTYNADVINPQLTTIRDTIDTLRRTLNERIDNEVGVLNRRIDSEVSTLNRIIEDNKTYLEDLIKKGMAYVYSSISGLHLPLQDVLGEIGNVLKQTLSYNWNSIDEFKNISYDTSNYSEISNITGFYYYDEQNKTSQWTFTGQTLMIQFTFIPPIISTNYVKVNGETVTATIGSNTQISVNYFDQYFNDIELNYINLGGVETIYHLYVINKNITETFISITYNSIKTAMEYLDVNYNSLAYTGVNTFYELNETEKLFDTDGVKSDYFTGNKYKVIHNNFDSDFFAYEEEENNENEGE